MLEQLKDIHKWFTGERKLPEENRCFAERAAACYLSAEPVKRWIMPTYDPVCNEGRKLLEEGISAGETDALRLSVYIDMGLWMRAKYDWDALPRHMSALYKKTGDEELYAILTDFGTYLEKFKSDREHARIKAGTLAIMAQGLPTDLGAHDPAYYEND